MSPGRGGNARYQSAQYTACGRSPRAAPAPRYDAAALALETIEEALAALSRLTNYERTRADGPRAFDLTRPRALLARLGRPDLAMGRRVAQVAGTKGKGSTSRFLDGIWRAQGWKTGRYSSPHLERVTERIVVDGEEITEREFAACVERVLTAVDGETTFFEALLAAACVHFAAKGTDAVVLEVGLGGRLDATTAVPTTHTIVTEISFDHMEILGDTLAAIAAEKAATIRHGVPVWSGVDPDSEAGTVIRSFADARGAPFTYVPPPPGVEARRDGLAWLGVSMAAWGRHQAHNAALAAAASGAPVGAVQHALRATEQPGCCEPRDGEPVVVLDGAHTVSSMEATLACVRDHFPDAELHLLFAMARDKDLAGMSELLAPAVASVRCLAVDAKRGAPAAELAAAPAWVDRARAVPEVDAAAWRRALDEARAEAGRDGLVLATGSLYLAGALRPMTAPRTR